VEERLGDTVALITGASSAIGAATARRLATEGAAVALVARRRDRLDDLAAAICRDGGTALVVQADLIRQPEAVGAVERTVAQFGRLDIVVNNAGLVPAGAASETSTDDWDQIVALAVQGLLYVTHAALLHLVRAADDSPRGVADLVNISFTARRVLGPGGSFHSPGTSGVVAVSEAIRQEMLGQRVRVSVVECGARDTGVPRAREGVEQAVGRRTEPIEAMPPADVADAVAHIVARDGRAAVDEPPSILTARQSAAD
jgi:NADP-dependent 3-hydroxy acid dehydrogenase YdfG